MGWLSRLVHGYTSTSIGVPTLDGGEDVRARIGTRRLEPDEPVRLESDRIEWRWDGRSWARWSALSRAHDRVDLVVPDSLLEAAPRPQPGDTFRLVDGAWVPPPDEPS